MAAIRKPPFWAMLDMSNAVAAPPMALIGRYQAFKVPAGSSQILFLKTAMPKQAAVSTFVTS